MRAFIRVLRGLPLLLLSPLVLLASVLLLALEDLAWLLVGRRQSRNDARPSTASASVVIPNWNGRQLLEKYLTSVETALAGNPGNEIIVVDNGSTDGSVDLLRETFPTVKVLAFSRNLGFGGGANAGVRAAQNDVVVLLNTDMRVEPGFLEPLLNSFTDELVFAVSCQILFTDLDKPREETGLTQGWWEEGSLRVGHRQDDGIRDLYPCFYGGGGSCAFDRQKFLELGGFDALFEPFYLEDTDLGYLAWKRGWKVLYQPQSIVYHEHRGTIGKRFSEEQISAVLKKNYILWVWKNIHDWRKLGSHFFFTYAGALVSIVFGDSPRRSSMSGLWRAFLQLPRALVSRWSARRLSEMDDAEAFRRPLGGYFRDRFSSIEAEPERLRVLFVSPYPICPPVHGGSLFMYGTVRELAKRAEVHVVALLEAAGERESNEALRDFCASAEFLVKAPKPAASASIAPYAVREFASADLEWLIHRQMFLKRIDVLQLEYTPLLYYAARFERLACTSFEHDIYFQSIARGLAHAESPVARFKWFYEYLRALRFELSRLEDCDRVQVCSTENGAYLGSYLPARKSRIEEGMRAGIDTSRYNFRSNHRQPDTMLFLGAFRHPPNRIALDWFVNRVLPRILERRPEARLLVVGSEAPPAQLVEGSNGAVKLLGFVDDVREPLERYSVFVCPILSGSGVRVKLLEAFASGIPVVSTTIGAEGLARNNGEFCALADSPEEFAQQVLRILECPEQALPMVQRARAEVVRNWDMAVLTERLEKSYRDVLREKRITLAGGRA